MTGTDLQLDGQGRLRHLLTIEGMERRHLVEILDTAESYDDVTDREIKKVPTLRGKTVVNLFFEASTRTRTSFELAAKRLSADVLNLSISTSAAVKGESLLDTAWNLEASPAAHDAEAIIPGSTATDCDTLVQLRQRAPAGPVPQPRSSRSRSSLCAIRDLSKSPSTSGARYPS